MSPGTAADDSQPRCGQRFQRHGIHRQLKVGDLVELRLRFIAQRISFRGEQELPRACLEIERAAGARLRNFAGFQRDEDAPDFRSHDWRRFEASTRLLPPGEGARDTSAEGAHLGMFETQRALFVVRQRRLAELGFITGQHLHQTLAAGSQLFLRAGFHEAVRGEEPAIHLDAIAFEGPIRAPLGGKTDALEVTTGHTREKLRGREQDIISWRICSSGEFKRGHLARLDRVALDVGLLGESGEGRFTPSAAERVETERETEPEMHIYRLTERRTILADAEGDLHRLHNLIHRQSAHFKGRERKPAMLGHRHLRCGR